MTSFLVKDENNQDIYIELDVPAGSVPSRDQIREGLKAARLKAPKPFIPSLIDAAREANLEIQAAQRMMPIGGGELWAARKTMEMVGSGVGLLRKPVDWAVGKTLAAAAARSQERLKDPAKRAATEALFGAGTVSDQESANVRRLAAAERMVGGSTLGQEFKTAVGAPRTSGEAMSDSLLSMGVDFSSDPSMAAVGGLTKLGRLGAQLQYVIGASLAGGAGLGAVTKAKEVIDAVNAGKIADPKTAGDATDAVLMSLLAGFGVRGVTKGWSRDNSLAAVELQQAVSEYVRKTGMGPEASGKVFRDALVMLGEKPDPRSPYFKRLVSELKGGVELSGKQKAMAEMQEDLSRGAQAEAKVKLDEANAKVGQAQGQLTRMQNERAVSETPAEVADLVDRLGESIRSQEAKRNFEWKPALHELNRGKAEAVAELSNRLRAGEITADEFNAQVRQATTGKVEPPKAKTPDLLPDEAEALLRYVGSNPELLPLERMRAEGALRQLMGKPAAGQEGATPAPDLLITKGDIALLSRALGKRFVDARYTEPFVERASRAQKVIDSLKAEAAAPKAAYEAAVATTREAGKAVTRESTRGQELMDLLAPRKSEVTGKQIPGTGKIAEATPPTPLRQITNFALDAILSSPRSIQASDLGSWMFRQGLPAVAHGLITRPGQTATTMKNSLIDYFSKHHYDTVTKVAIETHPAQALVGPMGLRLGSSGEGIYEGAVAHKLPVVSEAFVKPAERSFDSLTKLRLDLASYWDKHLRSQGATPETHPDLYASAGDLINNFTGTSQLPGAMERASNFLGMVNFAPRYRYSRWALPVKAAKALARHPELRGEVAGISASYLTAVSATLLAAKYLLGAVVEIDPRSSDFGKMRFGNTRFDLGSGFNQAITLAAREIMGQTKSTASGEVKDIPAAKDILTYMNEGHLPYYPNAKTDAADLFIRYLESGASPAVSYARDIQRGGVDMVGRPADLNPLSRFRPFAFRDVQETAAIEPGMTVPAAVASQLGLGVQTYKANTNKTPAEQEVEALRAKQGDVRKPPSEEAKVQKQIKRQTRAGWELEIRKAVDAGDDGTAWTKLIEAEIEGHRFPELKRRLMGTEVDDDEEE